LPLFVTLDPERDTRKVLSEYVVAIDDRIIALQGPRAFVDAAAKSFGVTYAIVTPDPTKPTEYSIDHTAAIFFVGPDGRVIKRFGQGVSPKALAQDIRAALASAPGRKN
jgi:protein SCO1